ncbi:Cyclin-dependent kinase 2 [Tritrichomonas foetus]|uniref:Cyclin-dependent kinase 2 n=1 Tax=Tritrichomonas foetus TaxID=1144522 RepID=A0A1J4J764_9EUKA|nr:Cyclin-dependent kinase 2 [Tritrichomonas foetus]|eukprot:OHS93491.1 Cyclin-dependent kinase 2 [Tritrichomonas foetus]
MAESSDNYTNLVLMCEGNNRIFRAIDKRTGEKVVIKQMSTKTEYNGFPSGIIREITALKSLNHPNIVQLREVYFTEDNYLRLIFELMAADLRFYLTKVKSIPLMLAKSYSYQLLCSVAYLHRKGIIHRGIVPHNILIDTKGFLKLAGFSLSRPFSIPESMITPEVTYTFYRAPEALLDPTNYGTAADVWSVACVIGEMVSGKILFPGDSPIDQMMRVFNVIGTPTEEVWPGYSQLPNYIDTLPVVMKTDLASFFGINDDNFLDLMGQMLTHDPSKRITAIEALDHPFFESIPQQLIDICSPI